MISLGRFVVEGPNGLRFYLPLLFSFWSDQDQNFLALSKIVLVREKPKQERRR